MDDQITAELLVEEEFPASSKFSKVERMYAKLERFIYWLANSNSNPDNVLMDFDEIVAELLLEFVKGINHYEYLPDNELEAVLKRMFDHRIGELRYKYYSTHRKSAVLTVSIHVDEDDDSEENVGEEGSDVADLYASRDRVLCTRGRLSKTAMRVFDAVIFGNRRLQQQLKLSTMRAEFIFKTHKVRMWAFHLADALFISEAEVHAAFAEIRRVYREVCDGEE